MSFPNDLSAFIPLIDGHHPFSASTHNELAEAIERIEKALGAGRSTIYGDILGNTSNGPKGRNASVRERLDQFVDSKGKLTGIIVKSGTGTWGQLSELGRGLEVSFGRNVSNWRVYEQDSYVGVLQVRASETVQDGGATVYSKRTPGVWWMAERLPDRCYFQARDLDCLPIPINDETEMSWSAFILTGEVPGSDYEGRHQDQRVLGHASCAGGDGCARRARVLRDGGCTQRCASGFRLQHQPRASEEGGDPVRKFHRAALFTASLACLGLSSCLPHMSYVESDRKFFDAIKGAHMRYVDADEALTTEQRARRRRLFEEKELALRAAEGR